jgi:uncharacterized protein (TIGR03083 family)
VSRTLESARAWTRFGTELVLTESSLDETALAAPSALPGWSRRHLVAHLAANADALGNLVHWAASGERTPMYTSEQERDEGIEAGARLSGEEVKAWLRDSVAALEKAMDALTPEQWQAPVMTAQGRTVPATEIPWLRARETCIHVVDLATGVTFAELPAGFLSSLCDEVADSRAGSGLVVTATDTGARWELAGPSVTLAGPVASVAAYLTGRPSSLTTVSGEPAPDLPPWL